MIGVCVTVFNRKGVLRSCLDSIIGSVPPKTPVVVVDDVSIDGSRQVLVKEYEQKIKVILNSRNYGLCKSANIGFAALAKMGCDGFIRINSDIRVSRGWYRALVDAAKKNPDAGVVGPVFGDRNGTSRIFSRQIGFKNPEGSTVVESVDFLSGHCMFVTGKLHRAGFRWEEKFYPIGPCDIDVCCYSASKGLKNYIAHGSHCEILDAPSSMTFSMKRPVGHDVLRKKWPRHASSVVVPERKKTQRPMAVATRKDPAREVAVVAPAGRVIVYTAIFGSRDRLIDPIDKIPGVDYVCFSDREFASGAWRVVNVRPRFVDPRMNARMYKVLPHRIFPGHDSSVWIDGSMRMKNFDVSVLAGDIVSIRHPERNCIYDEIRECRRLKKDGHDVLLAVEMRYRSESYPEGLGLSQTGFLFRRHNLSSVVSFSNAWWAEISMGSVRDQCSFEYVGWKLSQSLVRLDCHHKENQFFTYAGHAK